MEAKRLYSFGARSDKRFVAARPEFPPEVIARAKLIGSRGYTPGEVQEHLRDEGHDVPLWVIKDWCRGRV